MALALSTSIYVFQKHRFLAVAAQNEGLLLSRDREDSPPFVKIFLRIILMNFRVDCPF